MCFAGDSVALMTAAAIPQQPNYKTGSDQYTCNRQDLPSQYIAMTQLTSLPRSLRAQQIIT
jgi:membrane-bound inhibitor of C-type lysozyme